MKNKSFLTFLLIVAIPISVFAQKTESTKEGKVFGEQLRIIRTDISLKVCEVFNYKNPSVIDKIKEQNLIFSEELKKDNTNKVADTVWVVLGSWDEINGDNKEKAEQTITKYLNDVKKRCAIKKRDTTWVKVYRYKIKNCVNDYNCYRDCKNQGDSSNYLSIYNNGLFKDLVPTTQKDLAVISESNEEEIGLQDTGEQYKKPVEMPVEKCPKCGEVKGECICGKDNCSLVVPIFLGVIIVIGGGFFIYRKKKNASSDDKKVITPKNACETEQKLLAPPQPMKPVDRSLGKRDMMPPQPQEPPQVTSPDVTEPVPITKPECEWVLVGASVKGNGHIQSNMPCQDNHKYESLGNGWGIAVVSDGAGSAEHSEIGSKVVAERSVFHFKNLIEKEGWMESNVLPTDIEWLQKSYYTLKNIRNEVELVAQKNNVELKSLSATCLVVIYSPIGLLAVHVGDGRMGYKSASGEWRAMMTPHKGDEANQTIFLVSDFWSIPNYVMSGVLVPESIVVREPVKAFALMSDGCENTSWKCTTLNPATGKYYDQNQPFEGFFNPLEETLLSFQNENVPEEERKAKWYKFIESGTSGFVKEQDDKTMIYGVNVNL